MKATFHSWQGSETGSSTLCERESESNTQNLQHKTRWDLDWCGDGLHGSCIFQPIKVDQGHTCLSTSGHSDVSK